MKNFFNSKFNIIVLLAGLACGPFSLEAAHAAKPPLDWPSVFLCFFGLLFGLPFVIGLQLFRSDPKFAQSAIAWFGPISIYILASGVGAFVFGLFREGFTPQSVFFFSAGVALFISMGFCRVLCDIKTRKHAYQAAQEGNPNHSPEIDA